MTRLVSVCVPAYRQPEVLLRTLRSVLMQEGCDFELIVTDDSGDDCVESALAPLRTDPRLRYFRNPARLGAIGNWNASMRKASGEIIKILHHDDWFEEKTGLLQSVEPILSGAVPVVFSACRAMSVSGNEMFVHRVPREKVDALSRDPAGLAFANLIGPPSVVACASDVLVEFDARYVWLSDVDFYIRLLTAAKGRMQYLDTALINVTSDSAAQLSRDCEAEKLRSAKENIRLFAEHAVRNSEFGKRDRHFVLLAYSLSIVEILDAVKFAIRQRGWRLAMSLFKGLLMKILARR